MAKKSTGLEDIFRKTEAGEGSPDLSDLDRGRIQTLGVGLTDGERDALQAIADAHGVARNAVMRFAMRYFLADYRAGQVQLSTEEPPPPKKKLILPGQE